MRRLLTQCDQKKQHRFISVKQTIRNCFARRGTIRKCFGRKNGFCNGFQNFVTVLERKESGKSQRKGFIAADQFAGFSYLLEIQPN